MTKQRVIIRPEAQQDLREAALWYETRRPGLGERFATKIERLIDRIADKPRQFPEIDQGVRRALLQAFPYSVYFVESSGTVAVIAILHSIATPILGSDYYSRGYKRSPRSTWWLKS